MRPQVGEHCVKDMTEEMFKTVKDIVYFNCVLLPHLFIFEHVQIELFHVLFLLYPFQIDLNRSHYRLRVVIRTDVCTRICCCLFNTVSKSGVYHYVVDFASWGAGSPRTPGGKRIFGNNNCKLAENQISWSPSTPIIPI